MISETAARKLRKATVLLLKLAAASLAASGSVMAHGAELVVPLAQMAEGGGLPVDAAVAVGSKADGGNIVLAQASPSVETPIPADDAQTSRAQRRRIPKRAGILAAPEAPAEMSMEALPPQGGEALVPPQAVVLPATSIEAPHVSVPTVAVAAEPDMVVQDEPEVGTKYGLAPIKWGGSASESFGWRRLKTPENGSSTLIENLQAVSVRAVTYVIQPWLATVRGDVGLVNGRSNNIGVYGGETRTTSTNLTGGGELSVLAQSRFPFTTSFRVSDSRVNQDNLLSGEYSGRNDWLNKSLNMTQNYTPQNSIALYTAGYDRSITDYKLLGADTSSTISAGYSNSLGINRNQPFTLDAYHNVMSTYLVPGTRQQDSVAAYHVWMPENSLLTLRTTASAMELQDPIPLQGGYRTYKNKSFNSSGTWQPESEDVPLVVTSYARLYNAQTTASDELDKTNTLGFGVAGSYDKWSPLSLAVGATAAKTNTSTNYSSAQTEILTSNLATTQFASAFYRPPEKHFRESMVYYWSLASGFLNQTSTIVGSANRNIYLEGDHSLYAPVPFIWTQITTSLNQGLRVDADRINGRSETLTHGASVEWLPQVREVLPSITPEQAGPDAAGVYDRNGSQFFKAEARERLPTVNENQVRTGGGVGLFSRLSADLRDTRVYGLYPSHTESLRLAAGLAGAGGYSASGYGAQGDISLEATRQVNGPLTTDAQARVSWAYGYAYHKKMADVFGVRGLRYDLDFAAKAGLFAATGNIGQSAYYTQAGYQSRKYPFSVSLDQALIYRIGQNEARLTGTLLDEYGRKVATLFLQLRAWRNFGN